MNPAADPAAKMKKDSAALLRELPSVDELLGRPGLVSLAQKAGRDVVTQAARGVLADLRAGVRSESADAAELGLGAIEARVAAEVEAALAPSLRRVINATGVILHTNLGRAPLSSEAAAAIAESATRYSNLEYDLESGERGKRDVHTARIVAQMAGAEAAIVVNNNAAAVFIVLNTLAKGAEVIVSRGELIEIGDGFRIPDIMAESGAVLREVGTTNRTRLRDYERAINERTRLLLRVHPSNFRIDGIHGAAVARGTRGAGRRAQIPVYEDLGCGCLAISIRAESNEPWRARAVEAGAEVVSFSGDKLLGGPQAGIIAGKKEFVERIRRNPLFRALRVDKLTIAALEATLRAYLRGALDEIPALRMIRASGEELSRRAEKFAEQIRAALPKEATIEVRAGHSVIGGGSTPDQQLPARVISIASRQLSAAALEERLRRPASGVPVVARIEDDRLLLDLRTVFPEEESALALAVVAALAAPNS